MATRKPETVQALGHYEITRLRGQAGRALVESPMPTIDEELAAAELLGEESLETVRQIRAQPGGVVERVAPGGGPARAPRRIAMWKRVGFGTGWQRKEVPYSSFTMLEQNGWMPYCPFCQADCGTDYNACPARQPIPYAVCPHPACNDGKPKRIYDLDSSTSGQRPLEPDDPNRIEFDTVTLSPAERVKLQLEKHLWSVHPSFAEARGVPLPASMRQRQGVA